MLAASLARPGFVETLAAWCVVPYDDRPRTPAQRADALAGLGFDGLAWDWRDEHVGQFAEQCDALAERGLDLVAIWAPLLDGEFPPAVEAQVRAASARGLTPQVWVCAEFGAPGPAPLDDDATARERTRELADRLTPLAALARDVGLSLTLYNHLGWYGEPLNQLRVLDELARRGFADTGLAYMQHHGHAHVDGFAALWEQIKDRVVTLGLNGTRDGAHWGTGKVLPYGSGPRDLELAGVIADSGWRGTTALIGHTMDDIEVRLLDNLEGLDWVARNLAGAGPAEPPNPRIPEPAWPH